MQNRTGNKVKEQKGKFFKHIAHHRYESNKFDIYIKCK